jgi:hypothetical protein
MLSTIDFWNYLFIFTSKKRQKYEKGPYTGGGGGGGATKLPTGGGEQEEASSEMIPPVKRDVATGRLGLACGTL